MRNMKISQLLFWLEFYLYIIVHTIDTTAFTAYLPTISITIVRYIVLICTLAIIVLQGSLPKRKALILLCIGAGLINFYVTGFAIPLELFCLVLGANKIDFRAILKRYFYIVLSIMIAAFLASRVGLIATNDVIQNGVVRYAFGATYATDFAAHVFYLVLVDNFLNFKRTSIWRCMVYLALAFFIWINCAARLDTLLIVLLVILDVYLMINTKVKSIDITEYRGSRVLRLLLTGVFCIAIALSFYGVLHYNDNAFLQGLNVLSSFRLSLANRGIEMYGYPLFGQFFSMVGSATLSRSVGMGLQYFFVDNSYVYIMLRYGVVVLIVFTLTITVFINDRIKSKDSILPIFLAMIALRSIVDHHLLSVYNPFLFAIGAIISEWSFAEDAKFIKLSHGKLLVKRRRNQATSN